MVNLNPTPILFIRTKAIGLHLILRRILSSNHQLSIEDEMYFLCPTKPSKLGRIFVPLKSSIS